jgi:hypothetical protein
VTGKPGVLASGVFNFDPVRFPVFQYIHILIHTVAADRAGSPENTKERNIHLLRQWPAMTATRKPNLLSQEIENSPDLDKAGNINAAELVPPPALAALSEAEYTSLGRRATLKLDLLIMPCVVIMYILNYLDRQNIASAKLASIQKDLHMSDVQYQTCISLLFVGYSA